MLVMDLELDTTLDTIRTSVPSFHVVHCGDVLYARIGGYNGANFVQTSVGAAVSFFISFIVLRASYLWFLIESDLESDEVDGGGSTE